MKNERPKIKVPLETLDMIIELINISILMLLVAYTIMNYIELPEKIATHFNAKGEADGFGQKSTIWLLPGIAIILYIMMIFINRFPHLHNFMVNITEENALKNYQLSTRIVRFTNLFCLILFTLITYEIIESSKGNENNVLGIPFFIFTLVVPLLGIAFVFYYQRKINS
ncbi:MAG: hypothetical protein DA407_07865 [Bacteroidetes bacterium]|nr:MAG: hypothetical protein DA407_07865 [Bacteroidota bacterium]